MTVDPDIFGHDRLTRRQPPVHLEPHPPLGRGECEYHAEIAGDTSLVIGHPDGRHGSQLEYGEMKPVAVSEFSIDKICQNVGSEISQAGY